MSSTGAERGEAADQAYFLEVERAFLALRGRATLLAADDWQTAREWRRKGIPVEFVVAVMEALVERQRERRSKRGISSLRYFRAAVAAAWDEQLVHRAGGGAPLPDPGPPVAVRLSRLASTVPSELTGSAALRDAIAELRGPLDEIEASLAQLELGFLAGLEAGLEAADRRTIEERVERGIAQAGPDLPSSAQEALRESLKRQALRRRFGVPVLSLFSPVALDPPG